MATAITPEGNHVVSVSDDGTLKIWDLKHVNEVPVVIKDACCFQSVAISLDGSLAISH
jgi:WD40 repeat protein